jgi:hypothetical protein
MEVFNIFITINGILLKKEKKYLIFEDKANMLNNIIIHIVDQLFNIYLWIFMLNMDSQFLINIE